MTPPRAERTRNVAILGHPDAGKTELAHSWSSALTRDGTLLMEFCPCGATRLPEPPYDQAAET